MKFRLILLFLPLMSLEMGAQGDTVRVKFSDGQDAERAYNQGLQLFNSKNFQQAVDSFSKALTMKPEMEKAWYNRGLAYAGLNKQNEAIADFTKYLFLNDEADYAYFGRAEAYFHMRDTAKALEDYSKCVEVNVKYAEAWYQKGVSFARITLAPSTIIQNL